ncbi:MAG: bifunctional riboflavin kinase/FAD synthetase [Bacteroidetes bacterium]|nr:bifunctional riboflavin kinase/FAD synthetase [Bacteroidota bacterium]MBS1740327.1 bifunctional riboflavin kinase/FAD synthetase [Bacteroidota bacterium]
MAVYFDITKLPDFINPAITIGAFDGVHCGHLAILNEVVKHAADIGGESVVITFDPHPRKVLFPDQPLKILTPIKEKLKLIQSAGIKHIVVVPFTLQFAELSAEAYIRSFLVENFHPKSIVIGYDHHFGHDRKGNIHLLQTLKPQYNYQVVEIPPQLISQATISSTKIRDSLTKGNVLDASRMLGRSYSICGRVIHGHKLGRTIGYPTANIELIDGDQLIPAKGIYVAQVRLGKELLGGMLSVGFNPTVSTEQILHIEVNIFNFDSDIYDQEVEVFFLHWLRAEEKFSSLEALKEQLLRDQENSLSYLSAL